jgi:hypothetical protein
VVLNRREPHKHGERRSSAGTRRKKERQLDRDLEGTRWEKKDDEKKGKKQ